MTHTPHEQLDHDHSGHALGPGGHIHAPATFGSAFAIGITLNTAFVVVEGIFGYASNSMALVADAGHNLSDVLGLVVAWTAAILSKRAPSPRFTYGLRGSSIPVGMRVSSKSVHNTLFQWQEDVLRAAAPHAQIEGFDATATTRNPTTMRNNVTQFFQDTFQVTGAVALSLRVKLHCQRA